MHLLKAIILFNHISGINNKLFQHKNNIEVEVAPETFDQSEKFYARIYTSKPLCNYHITKPVDCSKFCGFDSSDLCMQTCASKTEITTNAMCLNRCEQSHVLEIKTKNGI